MSALTELTGRIEKIESDILEELDYLTPRQISDYAIKLSMILGSLGSELARKEHEYALQWNEIRKNSVTVRDADMKARSTEAYRERREIDNRIKSLTELIHALKKRTNMLELEARHQQ